ncbi:MAG: transcriptional regulator, partial [Nitrosopumilales archaeon CG15_BIG_FIL_POST_REV_8_21_14_020_33_23]
MAKKKDKISEDPAKKEAAPKEKKPAKKEAAPK